MSDTPETSPHDYEPDPDHTAARNAPCIVCSGRYDSHLHTTQVR